MVKKKGGGNKGNSSKTTPPLNIIEPEGFVKPVKPKKDRQEVSQSVDESSETNNDTLQKELTPGEKKLQAQLLKSESENVKKPAASKSNQQKGKKSPPDSAKTGKNKAPAAATAAAAPKEEAEDSWDSANFEKFEVSSVDRDTSTDVSKDYNLDDSWENVTTQHPKKDRSLKSYNTNKDQSSRFSSGSEGWRSNQKSSEDFDTSRENSFDNVTANKAYDEFESLRKKKEINHGVLQEKYGDLFEMAEEYSLAHCVAEDFNMGSGIATTFRSKFKDVDELLAQRIKQGGVAFLEIKGRYIYYMVTKRTSSGKPTYESFWRSLFKLQELMCNDKVTKLAIPKIGCGLDRLDWNIVKQMLEHLFKESGVQIVVCGLQPNHGKAKTVEKEAKKGDKKHKKSGNSKKSKKK